MDLNEVVRVLRTRWRTVVGCFLLGLLAAAAAVTAAPREYSSQVTMYVSAAGQNPTVPGTVITQDAAYQGSLLAKDRMQSYALLLTNDRITLPVIAKLGLPDTPAELASRIAVAAVPDTVVLSATVTADDPARAADTANALADEFVGFVTDLERPAGVAAPAPAPAGTPAPPPPPPPPVPGQIGVQVVQPAVPATQPVFPQPVLGIGLGALVGLLLGVGGAFLRNAVDTSVRSRDRLRDATGAPVLATVPNERWWRRSRKPGAAGTPRAEALRLLRTNLHFQGTAHDTRTVVVTGPVAGEGTTTTVCGLAIATADAGARVLVIDADLRDPSVSRLMALGASPGLAGVLAYQVSWHEAVRVWHDGALSVDVLPAGPAPERPSELLSGPRLADLLEDVREYYDLVLIDTPGLLPVADAAAVAPLADGVLLVARFGRTGWAEIASAVEAISTVSGRLIGSVLNRAPRGDTRHRGRRPAPRPRNPAPAPAWPAAKARAGSAEPGPPEVLTAAEPTHSPSTHSPAVRS